MEPLSKNRSCSVACLVFEPVANGCDPGDNNISIFFSLITKVALLMATAAHFQGNSESKAQNLYIFLIVNTAIDISIINTVSLLGPSTASILKGIANFFFPHFLPKEKGRHEQVRRALHLHLLLALLPLPLSKNVLMF